MTAIDKTYRIGRCNTCRTRPVFAWPATSGLRLDDVRCPRCESMLDKTSREARYIVRLTDAEIVANRDAAIIRYSGRLADRHTEAAAWREQADAGIDVERSEFHADRADEGVAEYRKIIERLQKAAA